MLLVVSVEVAHLWSGLCAAQCVISLLSMSRGQRSVRINPPCAPAVAVPSGCRDHGRTVAK
jgi:hypothetical protein